NVLFLMRISPRLRITEKVSSVLALRENVLLWMVRLPSLRITPGSSLLKLPENVLFLTVRVPTLWMAAASPEPAEELSETVLLWMLSLPTFRMAAPPGQVGARLAETALSLTVRRPSLNIAPARKGPDASPPEMTRLFSTTVAPPSTNKIVTPSSGQLPLLP